MAFSSRDTHVVIAFSSSKGLTNVALELLRCKYLLFLTPNALLAVNHFENDFNFNKIRRFWYFLRSMDQQLRRLSKSLAFSPVLCLYDTDLRICDTDRARTIPISHVSWSETVSPIRSDISTPKHHSGYYRTRNHRSNYGCFDPFSLSDQSGCDGTRLQFNCMADESYFKRADMRRRENR